MNFNANDNLVLVAPRPVRIASGAAPYPFHSPIATRPLSRAALLSAAADAFDRLRLVDELPDHHEQKQSELSEKENLSPRASPRYVSRSPPHALQFDKITSHPAIVPRPFRCPFIHFYSTPRPRSTPSEALEEFLSILQHPSAIRFQPTSPILRASNHGAHFFTYRRQTPCSLSPSLPSEGLGLAIGDADDKGCEAIAYPYKLLGNSLGTSISCTPAFITSRSFPRRVTCLSHAYPQPLPASPLIRRHRGGPPPPFICAISVPDVVSHAGSDPPSAAHSGRNGARHRPIDGIPRRTMPVGRQASLARSSAVVA